jgi:hypothetical protein
MLVLYGIETGTCLLANEYVSVATHKIMKRVSLTIETVIHGSEYKSTRSVASVEPNLVRQTHCKVRFHGIIF